MRPIYACSKRMCFDPSKLNNKALLLGDRAMIKSRLKVNESKMRVQIFGCWSNFREEKCDAIEQNILCCILVVAHAS